MLQVGIIGATGYTGQELLRILANHPEVTVKCVTSRGEQGKPLTALFPQFRGIYDLYFVAPDSNDINTCDVVFFATPHGTAHAQAQAFLDKGIRVIDLSADFRIKDADLWEQWYGQPHGARELIASAVYGLAEYNADKIAQAQLIAVPGCYPTAVQLGLLPAMQTGKVTPRGIIADCKSGISGAGRKAAIGLLQSESSESIKAYSITGHRHQPEIEQGLSLFGDADSVQMTFMPHLAPMVRGIQASIYVQTTDIQTSSQEWQRLYEQHYIDTTFVDVLPAGQSPETRSVRGSNYCRIAVQAFPERNQLVIFSVIDNLVKGAAGQAIQCFNLANGFSESLGLEQAPQAL